MELKSLHQNAIERAFEKAKHYRLLNDPENAESICRDILDVNPEHQDALIVLILSLADQFDGSSKRTSAAREYLPKLASEYHRSYYAGLICERMARVLLRRGKPADKYVAYDRLREAMDHYQKAEQLTDDQNDDGILRWNACVRTIANHKLQAPPDDNFVVYGD